MKPIQFRKFTDCYVVATNDIYPAWCMLPFLINSPEMGILNKFIRNCDFSYYNGIEVTYFVNYYSKYRFNIYTRELTKKTE